MSHLTITRDHARAMVKRGGPDVELWAQIADEIDEYLGLPTASVDLFGEETTEPTPDLAAIEARHPSPSLQEPEPEESA